MTPKIEGDTKLISYVRVSTGKQAKSGLGLEAQQRSVADYIEQNGGKLVAEYVEIESGQKDDRPELQRAIARCRRSGAVLLVARLDRLGRRASFLLELQDSGLPFICANAPFLDELSVGLLAIMAQHERKMISERTKAALQAAKRRGIKLGSARPGHWKGREHKRLAGLKKARRISAEVRSKQAAEAYVDLIDEVKALRKKGHTLREIADVFNEKGYVTRRNCEWGPMQVKRVLDRALAA